MKYIAALVFALTLFSCATTPRPTADGDTPYRAPIRLENNTFSRITLYGLNGGVALRIGDCSGLQRCSFWASERLTQRILDEGIIQLGWHWGNLERGIQYSGEISAWKGVTTVLQINDVNWFMYPDVYAFDARAE